MINTSNHIFHENNLRKIPLIKISLNQVQKVVYATASDKFMSERYFKGGTRDLINNRIRSIKDSTCLDLTERKLNLHAIPWNLRTHEGRVYSMSRKCQTEVIFRY